MITEVRTKCVYWPPMWSPEKQSAEVEYASNVFLKEIADAGLFNVVSLDVVPMSDSGYTSGVLIVAKLSRA